MGRRSRKRAAPSKRQQGAPLPAREPATSRAVTRRARHQAPPAPWGSFPLAELCVLIALGLAIAGLVVWGATGQLMLASAAALGSLAGVEVSLREHLAGHRSHTLVLAGLPSVIVLGAAFFAGVGQVPMLVAGAAVFAAGFFAWRRLFQRRSGGRSWR